jgi:hypothetical protein
LNHGQIVQYMKPVHHFQRREDCVFNTVKLPSLIAHSLKCNWSVNCALVLAVHLLAPVRCGCAKSGKRQHDSSSYVSQFLVDAHNPLQYHLHAFSFFVILSPYLVWPAVRIFECLPLVKPFQGHASASCGGKCFT